METENFALNLINSAVEDLSQKETKEIAEKMTRKINTQIIQGILKQIQQTESGINEEKTKILVNNIMPDICEIANNENQKESIKKVVEMVKIHIESCVLLSNMTLPLKTDEN